MVFLLLREQLNKDVYHFDIIRKKDGKTAGYVVVNALNTTKHFIVVFDPGLEDSDIKNTILEIAKEQTKAIKKVM